MSVTFSICKETIKTSPINGRVISCYRTINPPNFDATPLVDPDFPEYGALPPDNPWELNVTNQNCGELLRILGLYEDSCCGALDPGKLLLACDEALATVKSIPDVDGGTVSTVTQNEGCCRWIECGHIPGYFTDRFSKLRQLAQIALEHEAVIGYA